MAAHGLADPRSGDAATPGRRTDRVGGGSAQPSLRRPLGGEDGVLHQLGAGRGGEAAGAGGSGRRRRPLLAEDPLPPQQQQDGPSEVSYAAMARECKGRAEDAVARCVSCLAWAGGPDDIQVLGMWTV